MMYDFYLVLSQRKRTVKGPLLKEISADDKGNSIDQKQLSHIRLCI